MEIEDNEEFEIKSRELEIDNSTNQVTLTPPVSSLAGRIPLSHSLISNSHSLISNSQSSMHAVRYGLNERHGCYVKRRGMTSRRSRYQIPSYARYRPIRLGEIGDTCAEGGRNITWRGGGGLLCTIDSFCVPMTFFPLGGSGTRRMVRVHAWAYLRVLQRRRRPRVGKERDRATVSPYDITRWK